MIFFTLIMKNILSHYSISFLFILFHEHSAVLEVLPNSIARVTKGKVGSNPPSNEGYLRSREGTEFFVYFLQKYLEFVKIQITPHQNLIV